MKITFQREELYSKVWSKPVSRLSKELGITSYQLYKVCDELSIPTPTAGYWAKLRHDKNVNQPELQESDKETFTLRVNKRSRTSKRKTKRKKIPVKKRLINLHPLVKEAQKNMNPKRINRYNRVHGGAPLDISVSPQNIKRSLRILDTLLKEVEKRGYTIYTYNDNHAYWSCIKKGADKVYFQLREKGTRKDVSTGRWPQYEYTPTGELQLVLFRETYDRTGRVLSDTKSKKLQDRLDEFFPKLEEVLEQAKERRLEIEESHRKQKERRRIEKETKEQHEEELKRRDELEKKASAFTKSQYIYDFIAEIENQQSQLDLSKEEELKFKGWIIWARNHADRLNPIKQVVVDILE